MSVKLPKTTIIALALLFLAIVAMIALSVLNYLSFSGLSADLATLETAVRADNARVQELQAAITTKEQLQQELVGLKRRVPDDPSTMDFTYLLKELGWRNQGEIRDVQFSEAVLDGSLLRHTFTMKYDGKYYPLANLLEDIERLERFVRIGKVTLKNGSDTAAIEVEITADVFSQPLPEPVAEEAAAEAAPATQ
ncbi:MAG: type 4a pilus biogenesis protein PilO [Gracilibacteraceae bacterium]|jgi:Tfp pilus assembly protein PilO|nr:type 4a pilus biogenesis protein PilO [Gracilibacteraceae bacterium]